MQQRIHGNPAVESQKRSSRYMTIKGQITVATWTESPRSIISAQLLNRRFCSPGIIGLAGTLLLHALALQTAFIGSRAQDTHPPKIRQPGLSFKQSDSKLLERLVFVDLSGVAKTHVQMNGAAASTQPPLELIPIKITTPDSLPLLNVPLLSLDDEKESKTTDGGTDSSDQTRLFGIYSNQIKARVERIWIRPRSPINEANNSTTVANAVDYFHCQVQIVQDLSGNVHEVLLPNCNGSAAWQRSLLVAIQQASPLPAPPSPAAFTPNIGLNFVGYPYAESGTDEGYEPLRPETAQVKLPFP